MSIIFKGIRTPEHYYIYDRGRSTILPMEKEEFEELEKLNEGIISQDDLEVIKKYQRYGFLKENTLVKIEHPQTDDLEHYLKNHIKQLILQVTQRCNLRCAYCIYSGNYNNRTHAEYDMDFDTAKKAMDLYLMSSSESNELALSFYGGEPLLNIGLIKQCIEYFNMKAAGKKIVYNMTSNGTLLNDQNIEVLVKNHIMLTISMDGSKREHDEYRKFQNGQGSFDLIQKNLRNLKEKYPKYFEGVRINSVLNPKHDYQNIKKYFEKDDLIEDSFITMQFVAPDDMTQEIVYSKEFFNIWRFDRLKLYLYLLGKLDQSEISKLVLSQRDIICERHERIIQKGRIGEISHPSGPCIPGSRRVFVNVKGELFPCERVSETSSVMSIGHVDSGFDLDKASNLLNVGKVTEDLCKNCWAFFECAQCCNKADGGDSLSRDLRMENCRDSKEEAMWCLKEICVLKELGCTFER